MEAKKNTSPQITLIGTLAETPFLRMDEKGDFVATLKILTYNQNNTAQKYTVIAFGEKALAIRRYGFTGLQLWIKGSMEIKATNKINAILIFAEKVEFLLNTTSGTPESKNTYSDCYTAHTQPTYLHSPAI